MAILSVDVRPSVRHKQAMDGHGRTIMSPTFLNRKGLIDILIQ